MNSLERHEFQAYTETYGRTYSGLDAANRKLKLSEMTLCCDITVRFFSFLTEWKLCAITDTRRLRKQIDENGHHDMFCDKVFKRFKIHL